MIQLNLNGDMAICYGIYGGIGIRRFIICDKIFMYFGKYVRKPFLGGNSWLLFQ